MKRMLPCWAVFIGTSLLLGVTAATSQDALPTPAPQFTHDRMEEFLREAKITRHRTLSQGITNSRRATLSDGEFTHDAHIQLIDEYKAKFETMRGTELNFRDSYKYNIAAHLLDQVLELNMIPCSVERKFEGRTGAFTWWVDNVLMTELDRTKKKIAPPDVGAWNHAMYAVRVFDQLIFNTDRNLGNLVITKDWKVWMIDHTRAFRLHKEIKEPKDLTHCDRRLFARLKTLNEEELTPILRPYLNPSEIEALVARSNLIVKHFEKLAAKKGEAAVFYNLDERAALAH